MLSFPSKLGCSTTKKEIGLERKALLRLLKYRPVIIWSVWHLLLLVSALCYLMWITILAATFLMYYIPRNRVKDGDLCLQEFCRWHTIQVVHSLLQEELRIIKCAKKRLIINLLLSKYHWFIVKFQHPVSPWFKRPCPVTNDGRQDTKSIDTTDTIFSMSIDTYSILNGLILIHPHLTYKISLQIGSLWFDKHQNLFIWHFCYLIWLSKAFLC